MKCLWLHAKRRLRQHGAVTVELALMFPLLFGMFWAIISYSLTFFLYMTMNYAVSEAARSALMYQGVTTSQITTVLESRLSMMLPSSYYNLLMAQNPNPVTLSTIQLGITNTSTGTTPMSYNRATVTLTYPGCNANTRAGCIVPRLSLFLKFGIPDLNAYTASSTITLGAVTQ